jgi:hypothetical protein
MVGHAFLDNPVDDVRGGNKKGKKDKKRQKVLSSLLFLPCLFPGFRH